MNNQDRRQFTSIARIVWFVFCAVAGTTVGAYLGCVEFGVGGAIGMGLIGLIVGTGIGAGPTLILEFLSN